MEGHWPAANPKPGPGPFKKDVDLILVISIPFQLHLPRPAQICQILSGAADPISCCQVMTTAHTCKRGLEHNKYHDHLSALSQMGYGAAIQAKSAFLSHDFPHLPLEEQNKYDFITIYEIPSQQKYSRTPI
eukprot:sb/3475051/